MELDSQTMSRVWWNGAWSGALRGLLTGLAIGAASALLLHFVLIPVMPMIGLPSIAQAFAGFLTLSPGAAAYGTAAYSFSPIPLAIFSGISGMLGNMLSGGYSAQNAYKQDVEHRMNEARITAIEAREQTIEAALPRARAVDRILARGPRNGVSFEQAEAARDETIQSGTVR